VTERLEDTVAALARGVEQRYLGKHRGVVEHNDDPEQLGRLRLRIPSVLGPDVVSGWAWPCVPFGGAAGQGWWAIPEVGAGVWVEFEEGDLEFPVWVGTFWSKPGGRTEVPRARDPQAGEGDVAAPTRRVLTSAAGHTIQLEDGAGDELVLIHEAVHGRTIAMDAEGVRITDGTNALTMSKDGFSLHSDKPFALDASEVTITATKIDFKKKA
jgi:uncharacterized protein involved in type VI secretion and phage assembly